MARILAVDDSASMRQMVGLTLKSAGHLSGGHQLIDECTDPLQSRRRDAL